MECECCQLMLIIAKHNLYIEEDLFILAAAAEI
jgi:hypothetical protein